MKWTHAKEPIRQFTDDTAHTIKEIENTVKVQFHSLSLSPSSPFHSMLYSISIRISTYKVGSIILLIGLRPAKQFDQIHRLNELD